MVLNVKKYIAVLDATFAVGIAEVKGSNPVRAWIKFRLSFRNSKSGVYNVQVNSKLQHQPPGHLNFWRLACSNSLPSQQEHRSNAPPIISEIPLLNDKFRLQSNTVHTFQREMCRDDTFRLLLKTLLKELLTNKGKILSCKSLKPCKNRKTHRRVTPEQEIRTTRTSPVQIPHPSKTTFKFPPSWAQCTVKYPGYAWGVDV